MDKVIILCLYFGTLPGSFQTWKKSCSYNPTIDFMLVTDQYLTEELDNIKVLHMTFSDLQKKIKEKLNSNCIPNYPYKLCDYKPVYGLIFEDYLREYDYWGHCDMDLVFGDIRKYLDKYEISKYDKFLDLGHLSFYRNTEKVNRAFMLRGSKCGKWKKVLSDKKDHAFDEYNGIDSIFKYNKLPIFESRIFADISIIYKRFKLALNDSNYDYQVFYWNQGRIFRDSWVDGIRNTDEFIYIHFKQRKLQAPIFNVNQVNQFYIGPSGFTEKEKEATLEDVQIINPYMGKDKEDAELEVYNNSIKLGCFDRIKKFIRGIVYGK